MKEIIWDNIFKIIPFLSTVPWYTWIFIIIVIIELVYFYFKSANIKVVSWWSINIEWSNNNINNKVKR
jgi:uncharacterized membrane protein